MRRPRLEPDILFVEKLNPCAGHTFVVAYPRCADCATVIPPQTPYFTAVCSGIVFDRRHRRLHRRRLRYVCAECAHLREKFYEQERYTAAISKRHELRAWAAANVEEVLVTRRGSE
jgi:hypothetical protein